MVSLEDGVNIIGDSAILEESSDDEKANDTTKTSKDAEKPAVHPSEHARKLKRDEAAHALNTHELVALLFCFISPPIAAYTLHRVRHYLARPDTSPVENAPLTIFVLGAEILPIRRVAEMVLSRTLHLQRVVTSYDSLQTTNQRDTREILKTQIEDMARRLDELETRNVPSATSSTDSKLPELAQASEQLRINQQSQLDALNRAVRRYEKRALTQAIMVEGRLKELETRINDALTLAAAASRRSQKPGILSSTLEVATSLVLFPLSAATSLVSWPLDLVSDFYHFLFGPRRKKKKGRTKAEEARAGSKT